MNYHRKKGGLRRFVGFRTCPGSLRLSVERFWMVHPSEHDGRKNQKYMFCYHVQMIKPLELGAARAISEVIRTPHEVKKKTDPKQHRIQEEPKWPFWKL